MFLSRFVYLCVKDWCASRYVSVRARGVVCALRMCVLRDVYFFMFVSLFVYLWAAQRGQEEEEEEWEAAFRRVPFLSPLSRHPGRWHPTR